jgi:hypothetical protein
MKKYIYILIASIIIFLVNTAFISENKAVNNRFKDLIPVEDVLYTVGINNEDEFSLDLGKSFIAFKEAVGFKESQGKYFKVNTLGYLGKYQFGASTLKMYRITNLKNFLVNPVLQERVFEVNCARNKWILRKDIKRSVGKRINGVLITESGILAAAHLAGAGGVKKYLRSFGNNEAKDAYGSSVTHYMKKFAGYDTSWIVAEKMPKL